LVETGEIETTLAKAKAIRGEAEKLITKAKKGNLVNRRVIFRFLGKRVLVNKLMGEIAPRFKERKSGYLRIVRMGNRRGDNAQLAKIMFVDNISSFETEVEEREKKNDKANKKD